jgi:hypothetical protein
MNGGTIAHRVRAYIESQPTVKQCLAMGIVNLSALARQIAQTLGTDQEEAILSACRRFRDRGGVRKGEAAMKTVLRKSRLETKSRVSTITLGPGPTLLMRLSRTAKELLEEGKPLKVIQGSQGTVVILDDDSADRVLKDLKGENILSVGRGLVEISVVSPTSIEKVPGIMAYLSSALAVNGMNILQVYSCFTDTVFVMEKGDMMRAVEILNRCMA